MRRMLFVIALAALLMLGCGGATRKLQTGIERYERTDYTGALGQWSQLTTSERSLAQRNLVRYLVYRGLTHYRTGDRFAAHSYLTRGKDAFGRGSASWLKPHIVDEMDKALADLNSEPGGPSEPSEPAPPAPPAVTPQAPAPPSMGEALVPIRRPDIAPAPPKTEPINADPAPAKTAAASVGPASAKTPATSTGPSPTKISSPRTRTSPAVQSTSPK